MDWIEAEIKTTLEGVDALSALLTDLGINGIQIIDAAEMKRFIQDNKDTWDYVDESLMNETETDTVVKFYIADDQFSKDIIADIKNGLSQLAKTDYGINLGLLDMTLLNVNDEEWLNNWKKYYKPFRIGKNIVIRPVWEDYEKKENDIVFVINPGHVFGTGLHQSTKMCIEALEKYVEKDMDIADLGCGSGILSILSIMLGAKHAFACDIETPVKTIAYENADLNNVDKNSYDVEIGNIITNTTMQNKLIGKNFNIVVANIVADVIILLENIVPQIIAKDGYFICSGIIKDRAEDVLTALTPKFSLEENFVMDEWVCMVFKLKTN